MNTFKYDSTYYERVRESWTAVSYPIIRDLAREAISRHFSDHSNLTILDLGCGEGVYCSFLSCFGIVLGLDTSLEALVSARENYPGGVILGDAQTLPFPDNCFDIVFTTEMLEHILDWESVIAELSRVIKPGGLVLLTSTHYSTSIYIMLLQKPGLLEIARGSCNYLRGYFSKVRRTQFIRRWAFKPLGGHYHGFFRKEVCNCMTKKKFNIVSAQGFYAYPPIFLAQGGSIRQFLRHSPKPPWLKFLLLPPVMLLSLLNRFFYHTGLFANNFFIAAGSRKDD